MGQAAVAATTGRLAGLDALRGLMLAIVLADHCGGMLAQASFVRQWTLMGLGWSDAAEAFVFLSGFTFGWVYSARIQRHGVWLALRQGMLRTLQIYLAYLVTVMLVWFLHQVGQGVQWRAALATLDGRLSAALLLRDQPYAVGILCLYVVCLPLTLLGFVALRRDQGWLLLLISYGCYGLVQVFPRLNLPAEHGVWFFNPFAWQLLMVGGALLGRASRSGRAVQLPTATWRTIAAAASCGVVAVGLWFQKGDLVIGVEAMEAFRNVTAYTQWHYEWLGKAELGPLRVLHFAAMAYLLSVLAPLRSELWTHWCLAPLRACGRHSLAVYCTGVLLTHALEFAPASLSATPLRALLLTVLALAIQCAAGALLGLRDSNTSTPFRLTES